MRYDIEANILSWEIMEGEISHAHEFGNIIIHFSSAEKPILIEILDASDFIGKFEKIKNLENLKKIVPDTDPT